MLARHILIWPGRLYSIFSSYLIKGMIFEKKKVIEHEMGVLMFSKTFV